MNLNVYSSITYNSQIMERTKMSINWWMDKEDIYYTHTCAPANIQWNRYTMEYYSAVKKNEILPFATMWMQVESIMLGKIIQPEKDKYHISNVVFYLP